MVFMPNQIKHYGVLYIVPELRFQVVQLGKDLSLCF